MKLEQDNYRLTAYVLDELSPREKARMEKAILADPELKKEIDEIRKATALMEEVASLEAASPLLLDEGRRADVEAAVAELERAESFRREPREPLPLPWWIRLFPPQQWAPLGTAVLVIGIGYLAFKDMVVFEGRVPQQAFQGFEEPMSVRIGEEIVRGDRDLAQAGTEEKSQIGVLDEEMPLLVEEEVDGPGSGRVVMSQRFGKSVETGSTPESSVEPSDLIVASAPSAGPALPPNQNLNDKLIEAGSSSRQRMKKLETDIPKERLEGTPMPIKLGQGQTSRVTSLFGSTVQRPFVRENDDGRRVPVNAEGYAPIDEKGFTRIKDAESATSTFSADVDTASYSNIRRFLNQGQLPPADAVRIEELVNYFSYDYPEPKGRHPFGAAIEIASCPWEPQHRLARIGIRAASLDAEERPPMNLVFLIDVSGSMRPDNKLPLLKRSMQTLVKNLNEEDRVAIVTYAGHSGLVLDSTPASDRQTILAALENLRSGGSTAGASGIALAYQVAREHLDKNAMNRVILCTDGDFNVGTTNNEELVSLIRARRNDGIFLNIYGFGMGNIKDDRLEKLSNEGNGTYGYIDSYQEAQKVFGEQLEGTLATVAKDVKFQLEFNPRLVAAYRLIGYENRMLAREDFNDDTKDAGEVGAGHTVTALYEIVPVGVEGTVADVDPHRYIEEARETTEAKKTSLLKRLVGGRDEELFYLKIRYKQPNQNTSELMTLPVKDDRQNFSQASDDFRFAAAVAGFGQLLRGSSYAGELEWSRVIELAQGARSEDRHGHRAEFIRLAEAARELQR